MPVLSRRAGAQPAGDQRLLLEVRHARLEDVEDPRERDQHWRRQVVRAQHLLEQPQLCQTQSGVHFYAAGFADVCFYWLLMLRANTQLIIVDERSWTGGIAACRGWRR